MSREGTDRGAERGAGGLPAALQGGGPAARRAGKPLRALSRRAVRLGLLGDESGGCWETGRTYDAVISRAETRK